MAGEHVVVVVSVLTSYRVQSPPQRTKLFPSAIVVNSAYRSTSSTYDDARQGSAPIRGAPLPFWRQVSTTIPSPSFNFSRPITCQTSSPVCVHHFPDRLYFTTFPEPAPSQSLLNRRSSERRSVWVRSPSNAFNASPLGATGLFYFFTIDDELRYLSFFKDWGPLNISKVYKSCILIHELLEVSWPSWALGTRC